MTDPLRFRFDTNFCSGCKACQVACKDENNLPVGVLWRRVYEIAGGEWTRQGEAWYTDVFAYNLSLACNHCERPICAEVCPTRACHARADGIVVIDASRCVGCQYCRWACPYGAPQFDPRAGTMSKCDLCYERLERDLQPACVAACPLRTLDLISDSPPGPGASPVLPDPAWTAPRVTVLPHSLARADGSVRNREELGARHEQDGSLVAFTLLAQAAVGLTWLTGLASLPALIGVGALAAAAVVASLLHLGNPRNAWRVLANLRSSWLSREILATGLFGAGWALSALTWILRMAGIRPYAADLTALAGLALIISMTGVYRLRTVPAWASWRTAADFLLTAILLGTSLTGALANSRLATVAAGLLMCANGISILFIEGRYDRFTRPRLWLAALGALAIGLTGPAGAWIPVILAGAERGLARVRFYHLRRDRPL